MVIHLDKSDLPLFPAVKEATSVGYAGALYGKEMDDSCALDGILLCGTVALKSNGARQGAGNAT